MVRTDAEIQKIEKAAPGTFTIAGGKGLKLGLFINAFATSSGGALDETEVIGILCQLIHVRALKAYIHWGQEGLVFGPDPFVPPTRWTKISAIE